ncbi:hypothetical protein CC78DRAFT_587154 [Lojkania enalia]|uniref:Uncharacterized protein n=1 Tax=Lojkania enalia TaxID=147567 RepID=A0A9P4MYE8_9PLEO|nr:hypothetical protein CC78DRAFT_587154 [Didymosphaeria enalia]
MLVSLEDPQPPSLSPTTDPRHSIASSHGDIGQPYEDASSPEDDDRGLSLRDHAYKHDEEPPSGSGFTRNEGLTQHIRHVHGRTSGSSDPGPIAIAGSRTKNLREAPESLKHKRIDTEIIRRADQVNLNSKIKRLREENKAKEARLQQLEQTVAALQERIRK